jgi:hypothetical protein
MPEQQYGQRDEKEVQKQDEKVDEKQDEKSMEEKYRRDPLGTLGGAVFLIWIGAMFLAKNLGALPEGDRFWMIGFLGAGGIVLLEVVLRLLIPEYRRPIGGSLVFAAALIGVGIGFGLGNWNIIWPLVLVAVGVSILVGGAFRRKGQ